MKIIDAIKTAALFLQSEELSAWLEAGANEAELGDEDKRELDTLLFCCNLVVGELAGSDFPLRARTRVAAKDGRILYEQLPEKLLYVEEIKRGGVKLPFREFADRIEVDGDGECTLTYTYAPAPLSLGDDSPYGGETPSARLIAYGIAREYRLINGETREASVWDGRYAAAATEEARGRKERRVRLRRWI